MGKLTGSMYREAAPSASLNLCVKTETAPGFVQMSQDHPRVDKIAGSSASIIYTSVTRLQYDPILVAGAAAMVGTF